MTIPERIREQIINHSQKMLESGDYPSKSKLEEYYLNFRSRFGPEVIKDLDGHSLLFTLHDISDHNSLVYWLEYKNDEEFPAIFGSIAGGSALKYGIFRRKETGAWTVGTPKKQVEISEKDAIVIARKHRDQLIEGCRVLDEFISELKDTEYASLQNQMNRVAPDISNMAWAHKYFSLLFPGKLDDYHNPDYQRFHLIKLIQTPPIGEGRFLMAGRFISLANELEMPVNLLTKILNRLHGEPYKYWRIGAHSADTGKNWWDEMLEGNFIALGWSKLGDLSWIQYNQ